MPPTIQRLAKPPPMALSFTRWLLLRLKGWTRRLKKPWPPNTYSLKAHKQRPPAMRSQRPTHEAKAAR
jgi:hypothetical protein